jgi:hypothetical protein
VNIEAAVIQALGAALPVPAFADVPKSRPASFVTAERTGGTLANVAIDAATVAVQSWAQGRYEASELAELVDAAMLAIPSGSGAITRCARNSGPYNFPDLDGGMGRYQAVYELTFYKEVTQ